MSFPRQPVSQIAIFYAILYTTVKMGQDYYAVLGLTRKATDADIKKS